MAVASAGPYANHLHLAPDRQVCQHLIIQFFTGQMLFLTPNHQCQSTEDTCHKLMINAFSALTLLVGQQEEHAACKKWGMVEVK